MKNASLKFLIFIHQPYSSFCVFNPKRSLFIVQCSYIIVVSGNMLHIHVGALSHSIDSDMCINLSANYFCVVDIFCIDSSNLAFNSSTITAFNNKISEVNQIDITLILKTKLCVIECATNFKNCIITKRQLRDTVKKKKFHVTRKPEQ